MVGHGSKKYQCFYSLYGNPSPSPYVLKGSPIPPVNWWQAALIAGSLSAETEHLELRGKWKEFKGDLRSILRRRRIHWETL